MNHHRFDDIDGSSIFTNIEPFLPYVVDPYQDIIQAVVTPPLQDLENADDTQRIAYQDNVSPQLECVFLGTKGGQVLDSTVKAIIQWFVKDRRCCDVSVSEYSFIVGLDTETGKKGGVSLLQV
jgi:hypothetical protein